jgi:hypothetical protein
MMLAEQVSPVVLASNMGLVMVVAGSQPAFAPGARRRRKIRGSRGFMGGSGVSVFGQDRIGLAGFGNGPSLR